MDKLQIAHDLAVSKISVQSSKFFYDDEHICQKYFEYRRNFLEILEHHGGLNSENYSSRNE